MKKLACLLMALTLLTACGDPKTINGVTYDTYGAFTMSKQNPNIYYEVSIGNVVWSILLFETIIAPIYFLGFSLFEPVCTKAEHKPGQLPACEVPEHPASKV